MFINEYDILIDKILDNIFNKIDISKINSKYLETQIIEIDKFLSNIDSLTKNKDDLIEIKKISKLIVLGYFICCSFLNDNVNNVKTVLIKKKFLSSEELGSIVLLNDYLVTLQEVLKEENNEKLLSKYKSDIKFKNAIDLLNNLGYESSIKLKGDTLKNRHNLIKVVVIDKYYRKNFRKKLFNLIYQSFEDSKFIDIVMPKLKLLDFSNVENILNSNEIRQGLTKEILEFYEDYEEKTNVSMEIFDKIGKLFSSKLVIPITDEFLRFHKITEKYEKTSTQIKRSDRENIKDQTKIRYIITKIEKLKDYYSKKSRNNLDMLKDIEKMFYKSLNHRKAIIYNEIEELSIINKLIQQGKSAIDSNEFYHDLLNLRESSYVNFRDFKKNGFVYDTRNTTSKTLTVARYAGIESMENKSLSSKNLKLETKTISKNKNSNIVGIIILNEKSNVNNLKFKDITNIKEINQNGFEGCMRVLLNKINNDNNKNYYWIFDLNNDKFSQETYEHDVINSDLTNIMISKLYETAIDELYNKIFRKLSKYENLDLYYSNYINNYYQKKYLRFLKYSNYDINIKKKIFELAPKVTDMDDENENKIFGIIGKIYKLPVVNETKEKVPTFIIPYEKNEEVIDLGEENVYCQHIIDWSNLSKLRSNNPNKHSEELYLFIKKYVIMNDDNQYICKSCKSFVDIQHFLSNPYDGGTTGIDLIVNTSRNLNEIKEYSKFSVLIKQIDTLVEKISRINNFNYYIGNDQVYKLRRQDIIKQVIDTIIIHDKTLRIKNMNRRDREIKAFQNYGVSSDFTFFFIFPLSNDIFITTSNETDKFKKMKRNNIISYILFFIILELNDSQVTMFEFSKNCNYLLYNKFKDVIFANLKIRISNNEIVDITKYNTFCYILFYISCMISKYNLWYTIDKETKNKTILQREIIHTIVDLMNSLMEVTTQKEKNYLYEIIGSKIVGKINTLFKNDDVTKTIEARESKKININTTTNKIQIFKSSIKSIKIPDKFSYFVDTLRTDLSYNKLFEITKKLPERDQELILKDSINEMNKKFAIDNKIQLARIYDNKGEIRRFKISFNEASKFDEKYYKEMLENIKLLKNKIDIEKNKVNKIDDLKESYKNYKFTSNNLDKLINEIKKITEGNSNEVKINNIMYNLHNSKFKINYDYLGNRLPKSFYLNTNDNKIRIKSENNSKIYEIYDASNDVKLIFSFNTLHYLGYKQSAMKFNEMENLNIYIDYIPSIKEMFETLGFKKNIYSFTSKKELKNELRNSINNLKDYIRQFKVFTSQIKYKYNNQNSHPIIKYYMNKIDDLNLKKDNNVIFNEIDLILKFEIIKINQIENLNEVTKYDMIKLTDSFSKLSDYLFSQLLNLIEINQNKYIKLHLIFFLISLTNYFYHNNFNQFTNFDLIRYNYIVDMELLQEVRDSVVEVFEDEIQENENNLLSEEEQSRKNDEIVDNDELMDALDAEQEDYDDEEGGEQVLFNDD